MSYFCFLPWLNPLNYENHKKCDCVEDIKNPPNDLNSMQVAGFRSGIKALLQEEELYICGSVANL